MSTHPYRHGEAIRRNADEELGRHALASELMQHEDFLWAGRPKQGVYLGPSDILLIPFSLVWGGFPIAWEIMAIWMGWPLFFWLFGLPFAAMGLYLIAGRFFVDARRRARTFYAVTNRRVLILTAGRTRNLIPIDLASSAEATLEERSDGTGTITLGRPSPNRKSINPLWPTLQKSGPPTLQRIADARGVFKIIHAAQEASRAKPATERTASD